MPAIFPILIPLLTGALLLLRIQPSPGRRAWTAFSSVLQLGIAGWLLYTVRQGEAWVVRLGNWETPFGIVLVADPMACIMLVLSSLTALACLVYGFFERPTAEEPPLRLPLVQFLLTGVHLSFLTGDLFNLFVAFEVMLLASYALLTLEVDDRSVRHAFPYLALNLFGSALFLTACGLAYALFGTLNLALISERAGALAGEPMVNAFGIMLLVVFCMKAGVFPLYYWLPNSYPILPWPVAALYAGLLTKVGVYVVLRTCATLLPHESTQLHTALAWAAGGTMVLGVLGAVAQTTIRGILSYHILSQIGFMVLAIGFFTPAAVAAAVFYIIHHIVVKATLFLAGGIVFRINRSDLLERTGNLWLVAPVVGVVFLLQALSLAGLPPLSGFWGKFIILREGFTLGHYTLVAMSLLASILTLFSMLKIWLAAFWKTDATVPTDTAPAGWRGMTAVGLAMVVVSLGIGLNPEPVLRLAMVAAETLLDRQLYIDWVLHGRARGF